VSAAYRTSSRARSGARCDRGFRAVAAHSQPAVEGLHFLGDIGQGILDREMTGVQPMDFCMGEILEIRLAALAREEDVVLSPENNGLGLLLS
jgi:hypothetical protein